MNDSSIKNSEISEDPSREEIVAYLDGETSDEERRVIEQRLANDENYRQQLHQLERAWDMLDVLPQSQVDPSFVHTTMEMVAVTAAEDLKTTHQSSGVRGMWLWSAGIGSAVLAGLLGYFTIGWTSGNTNDRLLRDLPFIENVDLYQQIEDFEFLQQIDQAGLFDVEVEPIRTSMASSETRQQSESLTQRRSRINQLLPSEKNEIKTKSVRYYDLASEEQRRLRNFHRLISEHPKSAELTAVMQAYINWLQTLSVTERADLLAISLSDRVQQIRLIQEKQRENRFYSKGLEFSDRQKLLNWLDNYLLKHESTLIALLPPRIQQKLHEIEEIHRRRPFLMMGLRRAKELKQIPELTEQDIQRLQEFLSDDARVHLDNLKSDEERKKLMLRWIKGELTKRTMESRHPHAMPMPHRPSQGMLSKFLEELPLEERRRLEDLKQEDFRRELMEMYYLEHQTHDRRRPPPGPSRDHHRAGRPHPHRNFHPQPPRVPE